MVFLDILIHTCTNTHLQQCVQQSSFSVIVSIHPAPFGGGFGDPPYLVAGLLDPPLLGGEAPRHFDWYISDSRVAGQLVRDREVVRELKLGLELEFGSCRVIVKVRVRVRVG